MKSFQVTGVILKRKNVGEADRILTVFTRNFGKLQIKAIGVRKIASKRASHIEPLNISQLTLYKGKSLPILTEATTQESFVALKLDLSKIGFAYHICELIDGLCAENQENSDVFDLLCTTLARMETEENMRELIHQFELSLLTTLGYYSPQQLPNANLSYLIEGILERKLKARSMLHKLL